MNYRKKITKRTKMKLTLKALSAINKSNIRLKIALALGCTEKSVIRLIKTNNDILTKAAALQVIKEETGLTDTEILDETISELDLNEG